MNESHQPNSIPDDNFYKSAEETLAAHILLVISATSVEKDIECLPPDWEAALRAKYTYEDFEKWIASSNNMMHPKTPGK